MEKYSRYSFLPQHLEIHWFSIINSCVTVLLLTGFLATILMRVLKNDFIKYTTGRDDEVGLSEESDETGWKYIHGDVFRFPRFTSLFCAVIGVGTQLFAMTMGVFSLALIGVFYPYNRGALLTAILVVYALTSGKGLSHSPRSASLVAHTRLTLSVIHRKASPGTSPRTTTARWEERFGCGTFC